MVYQRYFPLSGSFHECLTRTLCLSSSIHDQTAKPGTLHVWHIAFGNQKNKDKFTSILFSAFKGLKCFFDKETNQQYSITDFRIAAVREQRADLSSSSSSAFLWRKWPETSLILPTWQHALTDNVHGKFGT
jgi:hypothetical protein